MKRYDNHFERMQNAATTRSIKRRNGASMNLKYFFTVCLVLGFYVLGLSLAWGDEGEAKVKAGQIKLVPAGGGATLDLLAFSASGGVTNGATGNTVPGVPAAVRPADEICVPGFFGICFSLFGFDILGDTFAPPFGFRGAAKPAVGGLVTSRTGPALGTAGFNPAAGPGFPNGALTATAVVLEGAAGEAAAEAVDPFILPPGDYDYAYLIDEMVLSAGVTSEFTGVGLFATDSRFSEPLWSFGVAVEGMLGSKSDLMIDFVSNSILALNDTLIEQNVFDAFSVLNGVATLTSFELFDTIYPVDQDVSFSTGVNAGTSVPEPTTALLFGIGLSGIFLAKKKRKWLFSKGRTMHFFPSIDDELAFQVTSPK